MGVDLVAEAGDLCAAVEAPDVDLVVLSNREARHLGQDRSQSGRAGAAPWCGEGRRHEHVQRFFQTFGTTGSLRTFEPRSSSPTATGSSWWTMPRARARSTASPFPRVGAVTRSVKVTNQVLRCEIRGVDERGRRVGRRVVVALACRASAAYLGASDDGHRCDPCACAPFSRLRRRRTRRADGGRRGSSTSPKAPRPARASLASPPPSRAAGPSSALEGSAAPRHGSCERLEGPRRGWPRASPVRLVSRGDSLTLDDLRDILG